MQRVALQILCGIDIDAVMAGTAQERRTAARQLARMIERERLKGLRGHWGYDLNRHIALKQALDRIALPRERPAHVQNRNGALRRRCRNPTEGAIRSE